MVTISVQIETRKGKKKFKAALKGDNAKAVEKILLGADRKDSSQKPEEIIEAIIASGLRTVIADRNVTC